MCTRNWVKKTEPNDRMSRHMIAVIIVVLAQVLPVVYSMALPPLPKLTDSKAFKETLEFSHTANWLIPGEVMLGHYPGNCPTRQHKDDMVAETIDEIRNAGICTFVCLQDEVPSQEEPWPEGGVKKTSDRAKWATGTFQNYRRFAGEDASYVHYKLPDLSVAQSLEDLDEIVCDLMKRVKSGAKLYIHCWGGRGRTGLVAACVLGGLYGEMDVEESLDRVQKAYDLRQPWRKKQSPETEEQRIQARDWFSYKRSFASAVTSPTPEAFGIWNKKGTKMLEEVSHSANHPLTRVEAEKGIGDARKLGSGRFGQVFLGRCEHKPDNDPVAIKVTYYLEDAPTHLQSKLALEAEILRAMSGNKGFPEVYYDARATVFGKPSDVLVMQLLGEPLLQRCWTDYETDDLCENRVYTEPAIMRIGRDMLRCLQRMHAAGFMHNDLKPTNMLFGPKGSKREDCSHLVDFGMATRAGEIHGDTVEGCELQAGGASPLFASLRQLEGKPTRPIDDIESLWYSLAFLVAGELPWQWEPQERLTNIKRRLFIDECGISSSKCSARVNAEDCCSTKHCFKTCDNWDVPEGLDELWWCIVAAQYTEDVDYDGCYEALSKVSAPAVALAGER